MYSPRKVASVCLCPASLEKGRYERERKSRYHIASCERGLEAVVRVAGQGCRVLAHRGEDVCGDGHCEGTFINLFCSENQCGFRLG